MFADDHALDCLIPVVGDGGDDVLTVSRFLEPRHLVGLAAVAHRTAGSSLTRARLEVTDLSFARYAARMRLGIAFEECGSSHALPRVRGNPLADRLCEVTALREPDEVDQLAALVHTRVEVGRRAAAGTLADAVGELGLNVWEHADAGAHQRLATGFAAAQTMPRTREIVFAIADGGLGLLGTLRGRGAEDDHGAIDLALSGTSRLDGNDRGRGLQDLATHVRGLDGSLYVASGAASVEISARGSRRRLLTRAYDGTLLQARIPLSR